MISQNNKLSLKEEIEEAEKLLDLFKEKIKSSSEIIADDGDPKKEKVRILKLVSSHKKKFSKIKSLVEDKTDPEAINTSHPKYFFRLKEIDKMLGSVRSMTETLVFEQYECKLELVKQELFKSIDVILGLFKFITPNITYEIKLIENFYRLSANKEQTIMQELEDLIEQLQENEIALSEFANGYDKSGTWVKGYDELRVQSGEFSSFQFYENTSLEFAEINVCYQQFSKIAIDFLSKRVTEPDFRKLLDRMKKLPAKIGRSNELFEIHVCINLVTQKIGKKYSFHERFKEMGPPLEEFNKLKNTLIYYHDETFEKAVKALENNFEEEADLKRFEDIIDEVRKQIEFAAIPFERLEVIFGSLKEKNFNIVLQQKEADDITVEVTPHHEQKFGRKNLERVNIIIQEIDFWYPIENKQMLFQDISLMTRKFQNDEPIDEKRFYTLIKSYDSELEKNTRIYYPKKIQNLKNAFTLFHGLIMQNANRRKLGSRLQNKNIWKEISPRLKEVSKSLLVLHSGSPSLEGNVNKFVFLKLATEELCQLLYDLAMQLFISYRGVDIRSVGNMTSILSVYNEFYDVYSLWSVFNYYFNKNHFNNFSINELIVIDVTKNHHCQNRLKVLFPETESEPQKISG